MFALGWLDSNFIYIGEPPNVAPENTVNVAFPAVEMAGFFRATSGAARGFNVVKQYISASRL
jgi:hypothetical protein